MITNKQASQNMYRQRINVSSFFIGLVVSIVALFTLLPFIIVLSGSFTSERDLITKGIGLWPGTFSVDGYKFLFQNSDSIVTGYKITLLVTVVGTAISLYLTASLAYVISINTVKLRNHISFFVYFTMLFSGGLVPWYILIVRYLGLKDSLLALILPMLINPFYIMLMRTYFKGIPDSLRESALMDGASEFRILVRIVLPVSLPIIATVTLFYMLAYWNDWYHALFFIDSKELVPLQFNLYRITSNLSYLSSSSAMAQSAVQYVTLPSESVRMATVVLTIGPIIFVYPFLQKHFVKGILVGSVKG